MVQKSKTAQVGISKICLSLPVKSIAKDLSCMARKSFYPDNEKTAGMSYSNAAISNVRIILSIKHIQTLHKSQFS